MTVAEAALNKLYEVLGEYEKEGPLRMHIDTYKNIDLQKCRTDGDSLTLAFEDGTTKILNNVYDYDLDIDTLGVEIKSHSEGYTYIN